MEHDAENDNGLADWDLQETFKDGEVWLVDHRRDGRMTLLGPVDAVAEKFAEWLAGKDFGERQ